MAEIEIKRVNFFDGQFLKQDEFIAFDAYHRHMRRRWAYVMFDKSGVVQVGNDDLTLVAPAPGTLPAEKKVQVKRGMAIAKSEDIMEGKEIVLQSDTVVDLTDPLLGLSGADTAVFTVHYAELPMDQSTDGDEPGDTRIKERAVITVHKNDLTGAPALPSGDSYVRLGGIKFNDLSTAGPREVALLNAKLFAAAPVVPQMTLAPNAAPVGGQTTVIVGSNDLNLASPTLSVTISPNTDITFTTLNPTTNKIDLVLDVQANAINTPTRVIKIKDGPIEATSSFTVLAGMVVTGFTAPTVGSAFLTLLGSGFTATQAVDVIFQGASSIAVPGAFVTATTIQIDIGLIPTVALAGTIKVIQGSRQAVSAAMNLPAKVLQINGVLLDPPPPPPSVSPGGFLTLQGVRFIAPVHVRLLALNGNELLHKQSPFVGTGESLADDKIVIRVPGALNGDADVRVETGGGEVVAGRISIS